MTYQLSTVRTRVQDKLDDASFSASKIDQFVNDGQRDILNSRRFVFMEREQDVTTTNASQALTSLPTDMQTPLSLRVYTPVGNSILLKYLEYEDLDTTIPNQTSVGTGSPYYWYVFNLIPYVYPVADDTYTLKLKYIKSPDELTADVSVPEIPESFSEVLVLAAYKRALEFNDENDKAQLIQLQIDEHITKMDERYKRQSGAVHIMRQPNRLNRIKWF
jgi:hypothetical protein